jgi:hypothetical protein
VAWRIYSVPAFDGKILTIEWKEALLAKSANTAQSATNRRSFLWIA